VVFRLQEKSKERRLI